MKAKPILIFSLLLNLIVLALGGVFVYDGQKRPTPAPILEPQVIPAMAPKTASAVEAAPVSEMRSLSWNDLISSDRDTYARNLRAIGCPEETIRDILTAAIAHGYDGKRQEVVMQFQQGRIDKLAMDTAVAQLWEAQNDAVARLPNTAQGNPAAQPINATPAVASAPGVVGAAGATVVAGAKLSPNPAIRMPLALKEPDPALGLSAPQQAAVDHVGDQFAQAVGASKLAPTDPAYHQLWQDAQSDADEQLKVQIGWEAYLQMELRNQGQK